MRYKGWLIYNGGLLTKKFIELNEWYVESAKKLAIDLLPIANSELFCQIEEGKVTLEPQLTRPDFVLFLDKDIQLARQLESLGLQVFNSANTIEVCDNKLLMHQQLAQAELPQPLTIFAPMLFSHVKEPNPAFLDHVEEKLGYPLIAKEGFGSFGEQVYMVDDRHQLEAIARKLLHKPHLFQAYIKSSHGQDIRVHVVGDRVVASMKRVSELDFRANVTRGGKMFKIEPNDAFSELAIAASKAVGADFSGVDLLIGPNDEPIICEVNSNAHIKNIYQATSIDVSDYIFEHILTTLKSHSS